MGEADGISSAASSSASGGKLWLVSGGGDEGGPQPWWSFWAWSPWHVRQTWAIVQGVVRHGVPLFQLKQIGLPSAVRLLFLPPFPWPLPFPPLVFVCGAGPGAVPSPMPPLVMAKALVSLALARFFALADWPGGA